MTNNSSQFLSAQHHSRFCQCEILPPIFVTGSSGTERYPALFLRVLCPASQAALTADIPEGTDPIYLLRRQGLCETQLTNCKKPKMGFLW